MEAKKRMLKKIYDKILAERLRDTDENLISEFDEEGELCGLESVVFLENDRLEDLLGGDGDGAEKSLGERIKGVRTRLTMEEQRVVLEYVSEGENLVDFYRRTSEMESTVSRIGETLGRFRESIGLAAGQIELLQHKAALKSRVIERHRKFEESLSSLINCLLLTENVKKSLLESEVGEEYVEYLKEYRRHLNTYNQYRDIEGAKVIAEYESRYAEMTDFNSRKIARWMNQCIGVPFDSFEDLRKAQELVSRFEFLPRFLNENWREEAHEIAMEYASQARELYYRKYRDYGGMAGRAEGAARRGLITVASQKIASLLRAVGFEAEGDQESRGLSEYSLSDRIDILREEVVAEEFRGGSRQTCCFESLFQRVTAEFERDVWREARFSYEVLGVSEGMEEAIFSGASRLLTRFFRGYIESSFDLVGMMIVVVVIWKRIDWAAREGRYGGYLSAHFTRLMDAALSRSRVVFEENIQSVSAMQLEAFRGSERAKVHSATECYTVLLRCYLKLSAEWPEALRGCFLEGKLSSLRDEIEKLIWKIGMTFGDYRENLVFVLNNYQVIYDGIREFRGHGQEEYFRLTRDSCIEQLCEEVVKGEFELLVAFVKNHMKIGFTKSPVAKHEYVEGILRHFSSSYKAVLRKVEGKMLKSMCSESLGRKMVEKVCRSVYFYYWTLKEVICKYYKTLSSSPWLIAETEVLFEIENCIRKSDERGAVAEVERQVG